MLPRIKRENTRLSHFSLLQQNFLSQLEHLSQLSQLEHLPQLEHCKTAKFSFTTGTCITSFCAINCML
jgi:hypothetical protein